MTKTIKENFKSYIFPVILLFVGAYLKPEEHLTSITNFFSNSSNSFLQLFNHQFYLWEILLYLTILFIVFGAIRMFKNQYSKKEKKMRNAIKKYGNEHSVSINGTSDKYVFKFNAVIENEEYFLEKLRAYCNNCNTTPILMSKVYAGNFRCNCGKELDYNLQKDVKSRIITDLENNE